MCFFSVILTLSSIWHTPRLRPLVLHRSPNTYIHTAPGQTGRQQDLAQTRTGPVVVEPRHMDCTTSYHHTCRDRNLNAMVGVLCLLEKTQPKTLLCCYIFRVTSWKNCKNSRNQTKNKTRQAPLTLLILFFMNVSLDIFQHVFLLFHLNSV